MPAAPLRRYTKRGAPKNETAVDDLGAPGADKRQLRRWARSVRPRLRAAQGQAADAAVLAAVRASAISALRTVGLYLALPDGFTWKALASQVGASWRRACTSRPSRTSFHELGAWGTEEHRGVRQPAESAQLALQSIDLLLVPGLLFDTAGLRVGFGKGTTTARWRPSPRLRQLARPVTVGVTYGRWW